MEQFSKIREKQILELKEQCTMNEVDFASMDKLLQSEKIKRLQRRNLYVQETISKEIEKTLDYENK